MSDLTASLISAGCIAYIAVGQVFLWSGRMEAKTFVEAMDVAFAWPFRLGRKS